MKYDQFHFHRRAQACIAQSYLTNSKRPESLVKGVYPTHVARGQGCFLWDHNGKKYLDFITALGTNLLGYANPKVNAAIIAQMGNGTSHSLGTHVELDCAEKIKELFPFVDAVKFTKTGSDACSAAIRIARAATGRALVLSEGYHGTHDSFVSLSPPAIGVPGGLPVSPLNPPEVMGPWDKVAAVIVEPVITDVSPERRAWLNTLREQCTKHGVLLIFDEIITGFRWPKYSVSEYWGITPDLICLGKAMAGGMPLAAVGGKYATMNCGEYFWSSTYAGETLSLAAATEVMRLLQTTHSMDWLWSNGQAFLDQFNAIYPEKIWLEGYPSRSAFKGDAHTRALFFQECCRAGILVGPSFWMNFPLVEEWRNALKTMTAILGRIQRDEVELLGEPPQSPFAQRMREKQQ